MAGPKDFTIQQGDLVVGVIQGSMKQDDPDATITIKASGRTVILKVYGVVEWGPDGKAYSVAKIEERHIRSKTKQKATQDGVRVNRSVQEIIGDPRVGVSLSSEGVHVIDLNQQKKS